VVYKPANFDPSKKYPTILNVYGGPHVQLVSNDFEKIVARFSKFHMYNQLGYAVVMIDGVGSNRRGLQFEGVLKHKMGTVEIADQVLGLEHLIKQGIVDPARIAITGWSYGGYLTLMALCQRPDFFKVGISGAPVTLWEAYDTGYTERYMDTPQNNPQGYKLGSVMHYVNQMPEEEGRLLIAHGLRDENVHFCNTAVFIDAMIMASKPYELYIYPKERHGMRSLPNYTHLEVKTLCLLQKMFA